MDDERSDIEKLLQEDIRDKKRTATGVFHRASRRGYVGSVRTQVDYLKGKAKKDYMKNGEVIVSNVFDDIKNVPTVEELRKIPKESACKIVAAARERYKVSELVNHWGFSDNYLYTVFFPEIGYSTRAYKSKDEPKVAIIENPDKVERKVVKMDNGFTLQFNTESMDGKSIQDRLMKYADILDENSNYSVKFVIVEKEDSDV